MEVERGWWSLGSVFSVPGAHRCASWGHGPAIGSSPKGVEAVDLRWVRYRVH